MLSFCLFTSASYIICICRCLSVMTGTRVQLVELAKWIACQSKQSCTGQLHGEDRQCCHFVCLQWPAIHFAKCTPYVFKCTCTHAFIQTYKHRGTKDDWDFRISDLVKNPDVEFRWSLEGPVSQIHSPHFHAGAPGIFSDFLKVCSDAEERVGCGKQREVTTRIHPL